jgi:hypothetical protein
VRARLDSALLGLGERALFGLGDRQPREREPARAVKERCLPRERPLVWALRCRALPRGCLLSVEVCREGGDVR